MSARAYILLDIVDGRAEQAIKALRNSPGVITVETLEGPPDVVIVMEARERQELARLSVQALALVEKITEHVSLLPVTNESNTAAFPGLPGRSRTARKAQSS